MLTQDTSTQAHARTITQTHKHTITQASKHTSTQGPQTSYAHPPLTGPHANAAGFTGVVVCQWPTGVQLLHC